MVVYHNRISVCVTTSHRLWCLTLKTIVAIKEYNKMLEALFLFLVVGNLAIGVTQEVIIPVTSKAIEVTTPVVNKAIDYVLPSTPEE